MHLAWLIQPSRDATALEAVNVHGSAARVRGGRGGGRRARSSTRRRSAPTRPGRPTGERVDESWPTDGMPSSFYARHKAQAERRARRDRGDAPGLRVVRLRPGLIFKREAASGDPPAVRRPAAPGAAREPAPAARRCRCRAGLRVQAVHGADVAEAYRLAVTDERRPRRLQRRRRAGARRGRRSAARSSARPVALPPGAVRALTDADAGACTLQPTPAGLARHGAAASRCMDAARIRSELGWEPRHERDRRAAGAARGAARRRRRARPRRSPPAPAARRGSASC